MAVLRSLLGIVVGIGLAACLQPDATVCGNGGVCPPNLRCAEVGAAQICVPRACGNGRVDEGELCDDGNNVPLDGCSSDCRSDETCGTGVVEPDEECDDNNRRSHDGCSSRCRIETHRWVSDADGPTPRGDVSLTFDSQRNVLVLVGGDDGTVGGESLNDTWEWDGVVWREREPRRTPFAAPDAAMAFDSSRNLTVLLAPDGSIWEWDGRDWAHRADVTTIGEGRGEVVYDRMRKRLLLLRDLGLNRWSELTATGTVWNLLVGADAEPPGRLDAAMAYEAGPDRVVLFGGVVNGVYRNDTWVWNGVSWSELPTPNVPPRAYHAMTYDERRGVIVMAGGSNESGPLSDVWELHGSTWKQAPSLPEARDHHSIAFDSRAGRVLMFGGRRRSDTGATEQLGDLVAFDGARWQRLTRMTPETPLAPTPPTMNARPPLMPTDEGVLLLADGLTWRFDGTQWSPRVGDRGPTTRSGHAFAPFDSGWLVVGGRDGTGNATRETWRFENDRWVLETGIVPTANEHMAMAYDPSRDRVVLFGGFDATQIAETWEWNRVTGWEQRFPTVAPEARAHAHMSFDPVRNTVVMFGGDTPVFNWMWEWDGTNWATIPGDLGPATTGGALATDFERQRVVLLLGAATWEWDGAHWTSSQESANLGWATAAYSSSHQRVLVFGSTPHSVDIAGRPGRLWSWDGSKWSEMPTLRARPESQTRPTMVYDAARRQTIMLGQPDWNSPPEMWTWAHDTGWRLADPATVHPGGGMLAYDASRDVVVCFAAGDTWEWDGVTWQRVEHVVSSVHGPTALAFDGTRVIMVDNAQSSGTWAWNGTTWMRVADAPVAAIAGAAFDASRGRVVAIAADRDGVVLEWDGAAWTERSFSTGPTRRSGFVLLYDQTRERVVLVGGSDSSGFLADAWEWDGTTWTSLPSRSATAAFGAGSLDPVSGSILLFGGDGTTGTSMWFERSEDVGWRDEVCIANHGDVDLDGQSDCADDDCALVCAP